MFSFLTNSPHSDSTNSTRITCRISVRETLTKKCGQICTHLYLQYIHMYITKKKRSHKNHYYPFKSKRREKTSLNVAISNNSNFHSAMTTTIVKLLASNTVVFKKSYSCRQCTTIPTSLRLISERCLRYKVWLYCQLKCESEFIYVWVCCGLFSIPIIWLRFDASVSDLMDSSFNATRLLVVLLAEVKCFLPRILC